jgi:hypothetical protein
MGPQAGTLLLLLAVTHAAVAVACVIACLHAWFQPLSEAVVAGLGPQAGALLLLLLAVTHEVVLVLLLACLVVCQQAWCMMQCPACLLLLLPIDAAWLYVCCPVLVLLSAALLTALCTMLDPVIWSTAGIA